MEFKVGDKVRRLKNWKELGGINWDSFVTFPSSLGEYDVYTIKGISGKTIFLAERPGDWSMNKFELVTNTTETLKNKMVTKKVFNVLSINKKTGEIDKDSTIVADEEKQAILKVYGVDVDNLTFKVTERTTYEEDKPQTVIVEKQ